MSILFLKLSLLFFSSNIEKAITINDANIFEFQIIPLYLPEKILGSNNKLKITINKTKLTI